MNWESQLSFVLESLHQKAITEEEVGLWVKLVDGSHPLEGEALTRLPAAARKGLRLVARARARKVAWKEVPADVLAEFRTVFPFLEVPDVKGKPVEKPERVHRARPRPAPVHLEEPVYEAGSQEWRTRFKSLEVTLASPDERARAEAVLGALEHWEAEARNYAVEELLDACQEAWDGSATAESLADDLRLKALSCHGEVTFVFSSGYFQGHLVRVVMSSKDRFTSADIAG